MKQTITRLFDSRENAENAVRDLEKAGVHKGDISILAPAAAEREERTFSDHPIVREHHTEAGRGAGAGATIGGVIGAAGGLLAGLGMIVIPGIGPLVAAGWIVTTVSGLVAGGVAGAVVGGIVGALVEAGVPEEDAHVYAEGMRRGGSLVIVQVDHHDAARVEEILTRERGIEASERREEYRREGWTRFDENAPPLAMRSDARAQGIADVNDVPVAAEDPVIRDREEATREELRREDTVAREACADRADEAAERRNPDLIDRLDQ
ncbi:MAG TPA: hypothetical protein VG407_02325 [Caulobacteraceae bacterium]|nr:hypothetical protein [Caulobacteraceae bacterium]